MFVRRRTHRALASTRVHLFPREGPHGPGVPSVAEGSPVYHCIRFRTCSGPFIAGCSYIHLRKWLVGWATKGVAAYVPHWRGICFVGIFFFENFFLRIFPFPEIFVSCSIKILLESWIRFRYYRGRMYMRYTYYRIIGVLLNHYVYFHWNWNFKRSQIRRFFVFK